MTTTTTTSARERAEQFCETYGLQIPVLMAPMAGACPPALAAAVANAGGMGACGVLLMQPEAIEAWTKQVREASNGAFQLNNWIPDPPPVRDNGHETRVRKFLGEWGPEVAADAADKAMADFDAQCDAILAADPRVVSSIMGLFAPDMVARINARGIAWFATVTTVAEAQLAEKAGADVIVAQGMEAGGHRGAFEARDAASALVGLFSLLPAVVDAVNVPVVATGGVSDARGIAAAMTLGASAVQIGTGLLRSPEAAIAPAWANAIGSASPEGTVATRAFSGRLGRSIATAYTRAANQPDAPDPAPYPIQRNLTQALRDSGIKTNDISRIQAWAGQSAGFARAEPAADIVITLWTEASALLPPG